MSTPKHYQFPNGAQPLELSRYLTSNGGQALQYVARSCRLDDEHNKHEDSGDDLVKAIHFLYDEIKRVGNERDLERVRKIFRVNDHSSEEVPVYFEGGMSVEYQHGTRPRYNLGTAFVEEDLGMAEFRQNLAEVDLYPATGRPKKQTYLTFKDV